MPSPNADLLILADEATGHQVYIHAHLWVGMGGELESEILLGVYANYSAHLV